MPNTPLPESSSLLNFADLASLASRVSGTWPWFELVSVCFWPDFKCRFTLREDFEELWSFFRLSFLLDSLANEMFSFKDELLLLASFCLGLLTML